MITYRWADSGHQKGAISREVKSILAKWLPINGLASATAATWSTIATPAAIAKHEQTLVEGLIANLDILQSLQQISCLKNESCVCSSVKG